MEFLLGLATGYFLTWPGLIGLLILGTIFEANEAHSWATFIGVVSAVVAYFFFSVPLVVLAYYIAGYFVIGFVWSFWRYKRHADKIVDEYKDQSESARKSALIYLEPHRMLGALTTWVIIWPFSMVENVLGDIIKLVQTAITTFFKGIYTRIYMGAVGKLLPSGEPNGS